MSTTGNSAVNPAAGSAASPGASPGATAAIQLPPAARSHVGMRLTAAAALGRFELQVCANCQAVQYPPREACHRCLSSRLVWRLQSGEGELISATTLHHSHLEYFRARVPWRIGLVRLHSGPSVIAHLHGDVPAPPTAVNVMIGLDKAGQGALVAVPAGSAVEMSSDRQLSEMTCDPRGRTLLVTAGATPAGHELVRALLGAGAASVWVGHREGDSAETLAELVRLPGVRLLPLDVTDARSVDAAAALLGPTLDILVNNSGVRPVAGGGAAGAAPAAAGAAAGGPAAATGNDLRIDVDAARTEMDASYFGLLNLARGFVPLLRGRGIAWVNILSVLALCNFPALGTYSAAEAAAWSLSQWLRAHLQPTGVRVLNVFPGPIAPGELAAATVAALRASVEDSYPGEFAQQWLARWLESPKVLERELAAGR